MSKDLRAGIVNHEGRLEQLEDFAEKVVQFLLGHPSLKDEAAKVFIDTIEDIQSPTSQNLLKTGQDVFTMAKDVKK